MRSFIVPMLLLLSVMPAARAPHVYSSDRPQAPEPGVLDREFMGMTIRDPWYDWTSSGPDIAMQEGIGALLAQVGARWVRLEFHIPVPIGAPGESSAVTFEIAKYDYFINTVAPKYDLKILALLSFGLIPADPCDLNKPGGDSPRYGGGVNQYMEVWLNRALTIADQFPHRIAAYEILNEQNRLAACGTPSVVNGNTLNAIDPRVVGRLITKFYRFCKGIGPLPPGEPAHGCADAAIVVGGIHPRGSSSPSDENRTLMTDAEYLQAMYTDTTSFAGFKATYGMYPIDGIGYHPYPEEVRLSPNDMYVDRGLQRMRAMLESSAINDGCRPFWITEVGYNVGFDPDGPRNPRPAQTEVGQALFLRDVYTTTAARQICGGQREIANVFWFKLEDFPPATGPNAQRWGVVRIYFVDGPAGAGCAGGACYDISKPMQYRPGFWTYRELAGLPVHQAYLPAVGASAPSNTPAASS